jgi:hypothetical protein
LFYFLHLLYPFLSYYQLAIILEIPNDIQSLKDLVYILLNRITHLESLVSDLQVENVGLKVENTDLRNRLNLNSNNSSKPPFALMLAVVVRLILKSVCVFTVLRTVLELLISNTFSSINNPCTIIFNINQPPFALMLAVVVRLILKSVCVFTVLRTVLELLISNTFSSINNPCTIIFNINQPPFALMLAVVVRLIKISLCVYRS